MAGKAWKLGIVGWPLGYSLSPAMHQAALKAAGLAGEYKEYPVKADDLWIWLEKIGDVGLDGFNVTMPYKRSVFSWVIGQGQGRLGRLEAMGQVIGAINTVVMVDGRPVGYNTDGEGFLLTLTEKPRALNLSGWEVLLLGAGGAARAVAVTLALKAKIRRLVIWNRHPDRAEALAGLVDALHQRSQTNTRPEVVEDLASVPVEQFQLVVNATPVGMAGKEGELVKPSRLHAGQVIYDLVYQPQETPFIRAARERGCQVVTGDEMLAGQGASAFEIWTGLRTAGGRPILEIMKEALKERLLRQPEADSQ